MAILKPAIDYTLIEWPKTEEEWKSDPKIKFQAPTYKPVKAGDRLYLQTKMITTGKNSGNIVDVQYIVMEILATVPMDVETNGESDVVYQYTANAKRVEV